MERVEVKLDGVKILVDYEVIEIVDDTDPYKTLFDINWAFENNSILNLINKKILFELETMRLVTPLEPKEGKRYREPIRYDLGTKEIDNLYNTTKRT